MKIGKPKSKRTPVRLRHRIEKASASKQRKERKESKKNPQWRSRLKKDPGIPNLFPYKAKLLAEIEEGKRKKEEEAQRRREVAKAQRQGIAIPVVAGKGVVEHEAEDDDDEVLIDNDEDVDEEVVMDERVDSNPMAALLASAQARARTYAPNDDEEGDEEDEGEWGGITDDNNWKAAPEQTTRKTLSKQALADPIKAVSTLLVRMQETQDGVQRLIEHYQVPALMTTGTDPTSSFLVEVARKRGRLGKGGVPNLHAAALTVLGDLNDGRLELPAVTKTKAVSAGRQGEVQVVSHMEEPFRIEGLFGDAEPSGLVAEEEMVVDA